MNKSVEMLEEDNEPKYYTLDKASLSKPFSIDTVMSVFTDGILTKGDPKKTTTPVNVYTHDLFWIIENPNYVRGFKCWLKRPPLVSGELIQCETVNDLVKRLNPEYITIK